MNLNADILAAHAAQDKVALVGLYAQASERVTNQSECAFFLTQAYIFALDAGDKRAKGFAKRLSDLGRL